MTIPLYLAVEDELSEFVLRRILSAMPIFQIHAVFGKKGYGDLKKKSAAYNKAANFIPFLLLTDLDKCECPPTMMREWLQGRTRTPNFLFRVAIPEIESWLLSDNMGLRDFLELRRTFNINDPEKLVDAKMRLLELAEDSKNRYIREAIVCRDKNGQRRKGPDYNGTLGGFVLENWNAAIAENRCQSLHRLIHALDQLKSDLT